MHLTLKPVTVLGFACLLPLAACQTQLQSRPDGFGAYTVSPNKSAVRIGVDYGLPMLQFQLIVERRIVKCVEKDGVTNIKLMTKAVAEPQYIVGERFVIDYEKLSAWTKVGKFELQTFDNGVIKSLNAEAEDQTASVIADVVKSGISILSLKSGVPPSPAALKTPPEDPELYSCTAETLGILKAIDENTNALETITQSVTEASDEMARIERAAILRTITRKEREQYAQLSLKLKEQSAKLANVQDAQTALIARISTKEELYWPRRPDERDLDAAPSPKGKASLLGAFKKGDLGVPLNTIEKSLQLKGVLTEAYAERREPNCGDKSSCNNNGPMQSNVEGLIYRSPLAARLIICQVSDNASCTTDAASNIVLSTGVLAPQLGTLRVLPFTNGVFQSNALKVTFRENGGVAALNYDEKVARAKQLSGAVSAGLEQVLSFRDARQAFSEKKAADAKAAESDKAKATLDALDNEIAKLEKQKKIETLRGESNPDSNLSDLKAETARLEAQIALLTARKRLQEAESALAKP
jgi:hypothetical protein